MTIRGRRQPAEFQLASRRRPRVRRPVARIGWGLAAMVLAGAAVVPLAALSPLAAAGSTTTASPVVAGTLALYGVACPNANVCEAVGENVTSPTDSDLVGVVTTIIDGVAGPTQTSSVVNGFSGVACPTATTCEAVGEDNRTARGVVVPIVGGVPGPAQVVAATGDVDDDLNGVACASPTTCIAVGQRDLTGQGMVVPIVDGVPGAAQVVPGTGGLNGVACADATTCEAVGVNRSSQAVVVPIVGGVAGVAQVVSAAGELSLAGVACADATTCVAVGNIYADLSLQGLVVPIVDGVPGTAQAVPGILLLLAVGCADATTCEAVGGLGNEVVPIVDGTAGAAQSVIDNAALWDVTCPYVSTCQAVGRNSTQGVAVTIGTGIAAPAASFTYPIDGQANVDTTQPFTWSAIPQAQAYDLVVGTTTYGADLVSSGILPSTQSRFDVPALPSGPTLHATLFTEVNGAWGYRAVSFTAAPGQATFTFPLNGQSGVDPTRAFTWSPIPEGQGYIVVVGTSQYGTNVANSGVLPPTQSSFAPPILPAGKTLYATLLTKVNGAFTRFQAITFTTRPALGIVAHTVDGQSKVTAPGEH